MLVTFAEAARALDRDDYQAVAQCNADFLLNGGFFDTSDDHETLITRPRDLQDNAKLSAFAIAAIRQCHDRHHPAQAVWLHQ